MKQKKITNLINPQNKLKFEISKDTYKSDMKFELSKVHTKKTFNVVGDYILNFSMLRTKKQKELVKKDPLVVKLLILFKHLVFKIQNIIF